MLAVNNRVNHMEIDTAILNTKNNKIELESSKQIEAEVIKQEDSKTTFKAKDSNGQEFVFEMQETIAKVGENVKFEVVKSEKDSGKTVLKRVKEHKDAETEESKLENALKQISVKVTEDNLGAAKILMDNQIEIKKDSLKLVTEIKKSISYVVNNITPETVEALYENGFNPDKLTPKNLAAAIKELNTDFLRPEVTEQDIKNAVESYIKAEKLTEDELEKKAEHIKKLYEEGIPVTDKNIEALESVDKKYDDVSELDEADIAQIMKEEKDLTLANLYIAKHKNSASRHQTNDKEIPDSLETQIKQFLLREGMEVSDLNLDVSKFLIQNDIPVTKGNIEKVVALKDIQNQMDIDALYESAIENIKKDKDPTDINLFEETEPPVTKDQFDKLNKKYEQIIKDMPYITDDVIKIVSGYNRPVTLGDLLKDLDTDVEPTEIRHITKDMEEDAKAIKIKLQLAEIQLKLTKESATRLAGKGIDIDTQPLEETIDDLKQIEEEIYKSSLRMVDAPDTEENTEKMTQIYEQVNKLLPTTYIAYHELISEQADFTIDTVANANKLAMTQMLEDFETFATAPSAKYGDSLRNVLNTQVENLLEDLDIETTEQNIKAAKILSKSQIDVTEENITEVKTVDTKIETISNKLHPAIAASMVKDGLNPTEMHVDEVISYIDKFQDIYGDNLSDKISKFIMEMDADKTLNSEERETMIAIYRLLNVVQKDESVAIGIALKSESELTLGNLMEASKYYNRTAGKREDININVDDDFGMLQKLIVPKDNIRKTLQEASEIVESIKPEESVQSNITRTEDIVSKLEKEGISLTRENIESFREVINNSSDAEETALKLMKEEIAITRENIETFKAAMTSDTDITEEIALKFIKEDVPITEENIEAFKVAMEIVEGETSSENSEEIALKLIRERIPITKENIEAMEILQRNESISNSADRAAQILSRNEIPVTRENIETFEMVMKSSPSITEEIALNFLNEKIPATAENLQALEILSQNKIAVTEENILNTVNNISLLNEIAKNVSSTTLNQILSQDSNAINIPVENLLNTIKASANENRIVSGNKTENRNRARQKSEINEEISVKTEELARALRNISKDAEEIIKVAAEYDIDLETKSLADMEKLAEPSVYKEMKKAYKEEVAKLTDKEKVIAEQLLQENNLGKTAENIQKVAHILKTLEAAGLQAIEDFDFNMEEIKRILHETMTIEQFTEEATPEKLQKVVQAIAEGKAEPQTLYRLTSEFRNETSQKNKAFEKTEVAEYAKKLRQMADASPQSVRFLEQNHITMTLNTMRAIQELRKDPFSLSGQISKLKKDKEKEKIEKDSPTQDSDEKSVLGELFDSMETTELESLKNGDSANQVLDELYKRLENVKDSAESREVLEQVKLIQNAVRIQQSSSCMKVPVKMADEISDVNIYVINDIEGMQEVKTVMSLKTSQLGALRIDFTMAGNDISLTINSNAGQSKEILKENENMLYSLLEEAGYSLNSIEYGNKEPESSIVSEGGTPVVKEDFYDAVSQILKYVEHSSTSNLE